MTEQEITANWDYVADSVMGGVSQGQMTQELVKGRLAHVLRGQVSLDNYGGFVQIATDLPDSISAEGWEGLALDLTGNDESYDIRLRTTDLTRPWQSFRAEVVAGPDWATMRLPFTAFAAHRHDMRFDPQALTRIGLLAIGRAFQADVAVAGLRFYR
ncbi:MULTISPECIES: CIA30 family protein [unclassified Yoonia]|uniref:CIA30 family protein n=1 Tax=unclassified Yoonia TaxID=2629118 RepID=UPI002AFF7604|nr:MULTISPECIES: CIA30 family protein [unclassified Yoonia]